MSPSDEIGRLTVTRTWLQMGADTIMREDLLRIPAGVVASANLVIFVSGDLLFGESTAAERARDYVIFAVCALPFLIPWSWASTRAGSIGVLAWVGIVAVVAIARSGYLLAWSFSRRPLGLWAWMSLVFIATPTSPWLAVWAAWRRHQLSTQSAAAATERPRRRELIR